MHVIVHWGCYRRCKKVHWKLTLGEKIPCHTGGINPLSVLHLAFQSDSVLTEPYRPCKVFCLFLFFKVWQQLSLVCCWQVDLGHWRNIYTHTSVGEENTDMWFVSSVGAFDLAVQVWWAWCFEMQGLWIYIYIYTYIPFMFQINEGINFMFVRVSFCFSGWCAL